MATLSPWPAATCRSTQFTLAFSVPPTNHLANGALTSPASASTPAAQSSRRAWVVPEGEPVGGRRVVGVGRVRSPRRRTRRRREPALLVQQVGQAFGASRSSRSSSLGLLCWRQASMPTLASACADRESGAVRCLAVRSSRADALGRSVAGRWLALPGDRRSAGPAARTARRAAAVAVSREAVDAPARPSGAAAPVAGRVGRVAAARSLGLGRAVGFAGGLDEVRAGVGRPIRSCRARCGCRPNWPRWPTPGPARSGRCWPGCTHWPRLDLAPAEQLGRPRPDREVGAPAGHPGRRAGRDRCAGGGGGRDRAGRDLLSLDAFAPASGVVARAAARLALIDRGLDPQVAGGVRGRVTWSCGPSSPRRWRAIGPARRTAVVAWIEHCCRAVELGARESLAICEAIQRG